MAKKGAGLFSIATILSSFFGAAMIAGAFAYFNYKFSEYKFLNFKEWVFYQKNDIFMPKDDKYIVLFYSSKMPNVVDKIKKAKSEYKILAIDYYQQTFTSSDEVFFLRSGTNTTLKFIQRFNIYDAPSVFIIKKSKDALYKQDSMIRKLKKYEKLSSEIDNL